MDIHTQLLAIIVWLSPSITCLMMFLLIGFDNGAIGVLVMNHSTLQVVHTQETKQIIAFSLSFSCSSYMLNKGMLIVVWQRVVGSVTIRFLASSGHVPVDMYFMLNELVGMASSNKSKMRNIKGRKDASSPCPSSLVSLATLVSLSSSDHFSNTILDLQQPFFWLHVFEKKIINHVYLMKASTHWIFLLHYELQIFVLNKLLQN